MLPVGAVTNTGFGKDVQTYHKLGGDITRGLPGECREIRYRVHRLDCVAWGKRGEEEKEGGVAWPTTR